MRTDNNRFQGICLVAAEGWEYMEDFDRLPPDIRARLRHSTFNLCAACVAEEAQGHPGVMMKKIECMEAAVRKQEAANGLPKYDR